MYLPIEESFNRRAFSNTTEFYILNDDEKNNLYLLLKL